MKALIAATLAAFAAWPLFAHASIKPVCDRYAAPPYANGDTIHSVAQLSNCPTGWIRLSSAIDRLRADGTWGHVVVVHHARRYVSDDTRGLRGDWVIIDHPPCVSGTYRTHAWGGELPVNKGAAEWFSAPAQVVC